MEKVRSSQEKTVAKNKYIYKPRRVIPEKGSDIYIYKVVKLSLEKEDKTVSHVKSTWLT